MKNHADGFIYVIFCIEETTHFCELALIGVVI